MIYWLLEEHLSISRLLDNQLGSMYVYFFLQKTQTLLPLPYSNILREIPQVLVLLPLEEGN